MPPEATNPNIPPRLRQAYCQQFLIAFELATRQSPFKVVGFSHAPSTLAARLRDCLLSMKRYKWGPELPNFTIKETEDGVYIHNTEVQNIELSSLNFASATSAFGVLTLTTAQLEAFCTLLDASYVTGPISIRLDFDLLYLKRLEETHNIAIELDPANNKFILL